MSDIRIVLTSDVAAAREKHQAAERDLNSVRTSITNAERTLDEITTKQWFGPEGEWKKLDGTCIDTVAGE